MGKPKSKSKREKLARRELDGLRERSAVHGLLLTVSHVTGAHVRFQHWVFREAKTGRDVLHYWPRKGSWWRPEDGEKGKCGEHSEALELARLMLLRVPV